MLPKETKFRYKAIKKKKLKERGQKIIFHANGDKKKAV